MDKDGLTLRKREADRGLFGAAWRAIGKACPFSGFAQGHAPMRTTVAREEGKALLFGRDGLREWSILGTYPGDVATALPGGSTPCACRFEVAAGAAWQEEWRAILFQWGGKRRDWLDWPYRELHRADFHTDVYGRRGSTTLNGKANPSGG